MNCNIGLLWGGESQELVKMAYVILERSLVRDKINCNVTYKPIVLLLTFNNMIQILNKRITKMSDIE